MSSQLHVFKAGSAIFEGFLTICTERSTSLIVSYGRIDLFVMK